MPTGMKRKETIKTDAKVETPKVSIEAESDNTPNKIVVKETETKNVAVTKKEKKTFAPNDGVRCKSITSGRLYMDGIKSHISYEWSDNGDVTEVEYQDIVAAIRSNNNYITQPYFVVEDKDVIEQFPQLNKIYSSMLSIKDIEDVFDLPISAMRKIVTSLPEGAKDSVKHLASKMISNGSLDSVQKIKCLDEIFGTQLILMTGLFQE